MLGVHKGTDHFESRGNDLRVAGRDTSQRRGPVRSPVAWSVAGGKGDELPTDGGTFRRCVPNRGELGAPLRTGRLCRFERRRAGRKAVAIKPDGPGTCGRGPAAQPSPLRASGPAVGRPAPLGVPPAAVRGDPERAAMPKVISTVWIPATQTAPAGGPNRFCFAGRTQKNFTRSPTIPTSTFGRWMRSIFSNTAVAVGCGFLRKSKIRSACTPRPAKASATSAPCGFGTGSFAPPNRKTDLMPGPAGASFAGCAGSAPVLGAALSSSLTMPSSRSGLALIPFSSASVPLNDMRINFRRCV